MRKNRVLFRCTYFHLRIHYKHVNKIEDAYIYFSTRFLAQCLELA